ncbi:hypothetical protein J3E71DRAFT_360377 [Bipolaris maydis]|nr:hypothetical protein J3E71DRAFT_360377 [Bipolaris maydis]
MSQPQQYPTLLVQTQEVRSLCCVQAVLGMCNLYYHGQAQLQIGNMRRQMAIAEQELQRERDSNELLNQEKLKEFADEVSQRAEGLVNSYRAKLAGNEVGELQNGQTISGMILESAKNALLIKAISSQHPEDEHFAKLKYRNLELSKMNETLSQQVRNNEDEIASLNKALKLAVEDGQRRKPRRGKICYGGQTIAIEMKPQCMQKSKQSRNAVQYIDFLNRRNGELRLELTFYRECYRHTEKFKQKITNISQDLLHACILRDDQGEVFDAFVAPYKALNSSKNTTVSKDGWI